jgi:hypothetical protein
MKTKPLYETLLKHLGEDDLTIIKRVISNYTFIDYGIVQEYKEGIINVKLAHKLMSKDIFLENIEVLTIGSKALSTRYELVEGDIVELLSSKSLVDSIAELTVATVNTTMPYSNVTIKALPLTGHDNAKNKIDIAEDGSITIVGNGYDITITTDGALKINSKAIELNGDGKRFITWDEFNTEYQRVLGIIKGHTHTGDGYSPSPTLTAMSSDISTAKTTTLKTNG